MSKNINANEKDDFKDVLKVEGVRARGYGLIAKMVMQDRRLTPYAKAIYSYFCSFAGAGMTAFPSVSKICYDMVFTEDTFRKHLKILVAYDYIRTEQKRNEDGRFKHNIYTLVDKPNPQTPDIPKKPADPENIGDGKKRPPKNKGTKSNSSSKIISLERERGKILKVKNSFFKKRKEKKEPDKKIVPPDYSNRESVVQFFVNNGNPESIVKKEYSKFKRIVKCKNIEDLHSYFVAMVTNAVEKTKNGNSNNGTSKPKRTGKGNGNGKRISRPDPRDWEGMLGLN